MRPIVARPDLRRRGGARRLRLEELLTRRDWTVYATNVRNSRGWHLTDRPESTFLIVKYFYRGVVAAMEPTKQDAEAMLNQAGGIQLAVRARTPREHVPFFAYGLLLALLAPIRDLGDDSVVAGIGQWIVMGGAAAVLITHLRQFRQVRVSPRTPIWLALAFGAWVVPVTTFLPGLLDGTIDWTAFSVWLSALLHARGDDVVRVKGVVRTPAGRLLVQSVRKVVQSPEILPARADDGEREDGTIVVIGRGYRGEDLGRSLRYFASAGRARPGHDVGTATELGLT